jgi:hypothetical protein
LPERTKVLGTIEPVIANRAAALFLMKAMTMFFILKNREGFHAWVNKR